jgi:hypothetical protein
MTYSLATIRLNARAIPVLRGQLSFLGLFDMPPLIPRHADTAAAHNSDNGCQPALVACVGAMRWPASSNSSPVSKWSPP